MNHLRVGAELAGTIDTCGRSSECRFFLDFLCNIFSSPIMILPIFL